LALTLALLAPAAVASAQDAHPRRAYAKFLLSADAPAVLVAPDRAWVPNVQPEQVLSLCDAHGRCRPVVERTTCEPPACPGFGPLLRVRGEVADVDEYPDGLESFIEEGDAVFADPVLAPLAGWRGSHPDANAGPLHWVTDEREGFGWELDLHGAFGFASRLGAVAGGTASFGLRISTEEDDSYDMDDSEDDVLDSLLGDHFGLDVRTHVLRTLDEQDPGTIVGVGVAPSAWNGVGEGRLRVPTYLSLALPEMGGIGGAGRRAAFYVGWNLPVSILLSDSVALDARASLYIVDAWRKGDGTDVLFEAAIGIVLR
jgi:hypothetical protein